MVKKWFLSASLQLISLNDKQGSFTFCSTRGLSVTDYLLLNIFDRDSFFDIEISNWSAF